MATTAKPADPSFAPREVAINEPSERHVVKPYISNEPVRLYTFDADYNLKPCEPLAPTRRRVPQRRRRASRGKPIRRRGSRRAARPSRAGPSGSDDPHLAEEPEPPSRHRGRHPRLRRRGVVALSLTFMELWGRWVDCPAHCRQVAFGSLARHEQDSCWDALARECDERNEFERRELYLEPPKRHQPRQRSTAATSTRPGTVALSSADDPLKAVPPDVYFEALAGIVVPPNGWVSCPMPDHEDLHPSCQVLSTHCAASDAVGVAASST